MPLHIPIFVNSEEIMAIHIGREVPFTGPLDEHEYVVTAKEWPQTLYEGKPRTYTPDWDSGVHFTHTYADGALTCARKAIEALEGIEKATRG